MEDVRKEYKRLLADAEAREGFRQALAKALDARYGAGTLEEAENFLASKEAACGG